MSIESHQESLEDALGGRQRYRIPNYQRPYVWEYDQAFELASDLRSAWERGDDDYFLGSIVVVRAPGEDVSEVVDGQQRLTTLAIMFSVIRDLVGKELRGALTQHLQTEDDPIKGVEASPRVEVHEEDREFFQNYIVDGDLAGLREQSASRFARSGQRNMRRSVDAMYDVLTGVDPGELRDLTRFVRGVTLIVVETAQFDHAYRIFGVLNTRGVDLSAADVFKSEVLSRIDRPLRDEYANRWSRALENVSGHPDAFFMQLLVSTSKTPPKRALALEFKQLVIDRLESSSQARAFIDDSLSPLSVAYRKVATSPLDDVSEPLDLLSDYSSADWKPPAMWVLSHVQNQAERDRLLLGIDRVFGLHTVAGSSATQRSKAMLRVLQDLESGRKVRFDVSDQTLYAALVAIHGALPRSAKRVTLLRRAHWQASGPEGLLDPSASWVSVLQRNHHNAAEWEEMEAWSSRLGTLALSVASNQRVAATKQWEELRQLVNPRDPRRDSVVTTAPIAPPTGESVKKRHEQLISLIVDFWDMERNSEGLKVSEVPEKQLMELAGAGKITRARATTIGDVFLLGLLSEGDTLVWDRPVKGERHKAVVTRDGRLRLRSGKVATSASAAAMEASGSAGRALDYWKRESDGQSLRDIFDRYERYFVSGEKPRRPAAASARPTSQTPRSKTRGPSPTSSSAPTPEKGARPTPQPPHSVSSAPKATETPPRAPTGSGTPARTDDTRRFARPKGETSPLTGDGITSSEAGITVQMTVTDQHSTRAWSEITSQTARKLGLSPGDSRDFRTRRGTVMVSWQHFNKPRLGDIRPYLVDAELLVGDKMKLQFTPGGTFRLSKVQQPQSARSTTTPVPSVEQTGEWSTNLMKRRLEQIGAEYEDNRLSSGALWVYEHPDAKAVIDEANRRGANFKLKRGFRKGRRAWWSKTDK